MKKIKIIVVSVLALVLCLMCVTTSTFSWFPRPKENKGSSLGLDFDYAVSDGAGISMSTYSSSDGINYSEAAVTDFSNSTGLASKACAYYRTDIMNTGTVPQSVSLYISQLTMDSSSTGNFFLGVNDPLKTYKQYPKITNSGSSGSTTYTKENVAESTVRIYFQPNNVDSWKESATTIKIRCGTGDVSNPNFTDGITMTYISSYSTARTLYADIPSNTTVCQIYANDDTTGANATPYMLLSAYCPEFSSNMKSYLFVLRSETIVYSNHNCDTHKVDNGANIYSQYKTINISQGDRFTASLISGTDYTGKEIHYYDDNSGVFTANETTGEIKANAVGTSTLYTKVVGEYGDAFQVETTVNVVAANPDVVDTGSTDIPIVTNVKVGGVSDENKPGVVSVYWFIKNDSDNRPLKYSIRDIYLTL